jgi:hypothetical protein
MFRLPYKTIFRLQFQKAFFDIQLAMSFKDTPNFVLFSLMACYTDELNFDIYYRLILVLNWIRW